MTYQIELARDPILLQCALHERPRLLQILLCTQTNKKHITNSPPINSNPMRSIEKIAINPMRSIENINRDRQDGLRNKCLPRYWGKRVEKELTSSMPPSFQAGSNFSIFQRSMLGSSSHGLGLSCFPFRRQFLPSAASASSATAAAAFASSSDAMAEKKEGLAPAGPSRNWSRKMRR